MAHVLDAVTPKVEEIAPRKPGLMDRIRSRRGRGRGGSAAPVPGERAPRPAKKRSVGKRVSLDSDISDIWGFAGRRLEATPHFATGRMLEYQAPAAGMIIDRAVAGSLPTVCSSSRSLATGTSMRTWLPFRRPAAHLRHHHQWPPARGAALGQPQWTEDDFAKYHELAGRQEMLKEMFIWVLSMMLPRLAEGKKKADEKKAKADAAIAEAFPDLAGEDPVETFATMLFRYAARVALERLPLELWQERSPLPRRLFRRGDWGDLALHDKASRRCVHDCFYHSQRNHSRATERNASA